MRKKSELKKALDSIAPAEDPRRYWSRPKDDWHGQTEHGRKCLEEMRRMLATPLRKPGIWWAERILERAARGDRIAPYALQCAREAIEERGAKRIPGEDDE